MSNLDRKSDMRERLSRANVTSLYFDKTLPSLGDAGGKLRAYITSPQMKQDFKDRKGMWIYGSAKGRVFALPVLAKELVGLGYTVRLQTLHELATLIRLDEEAADRMERYPILCVNDFQKEIAECPYSYSERESVEQFLCDRLGAGRITCFSSCKPLQANDWWSSEFRAMFKPHIRECAF